ncbi:mitotic checkpoint serine/threonine-protein kinase BUB1 beta-like isoform X1 [Diorhabda sublineata]|uniref:mitotic checkpoint serine/threonine-protein kinase BUB1 beta-like isoform X1 n=1 Tax=Diorhabda sublineata TaxID=1163346 RepID=UPI0024E18E21|nr:mitotic checkpoint serine/threonine-protein kinase BUB1 beta-like isoform X1 [Diorhabda sublineata]
MDFEFSKENILPLPGGRNVHQLGIALQAQTNRECQMELAQQKQQWEELIRTYSGDDPLENYYKYISWIEQTYPKHGHEGNLIPLLEHCLNKFESDRRYINDRRFCKLWIKYFDSQPNPLEFYHMLKAKGLCTGCADFYKAMAYYHEAAGDFQAANNVFEEGKRNLAQPYEELENAHQNLIVAAGQHVIFGPNQSNLIEKRQALTALHTYRPGRVGSVRVPSSNPMVTFPSNSSISSRSNAVVHIHEDRAGEEASAVVEAPPVSIIAAVKRQEMPKENTLKAGPWTNIVPVKKRVIGSGSSGNLATGFTVHEDIDMPREIIFPKVTLEDYSDWVVNVYYPEPPNPNAIPMYPKHRVYGEPNTEYSLEELRSSRYIRKTPEVYEPIVTDDPEVEFVEEIPPSRQQNEELPQIQKQEILVNNSPQSFHQLANSPQNFTRNSFQKDPQMRNSISNGTMQCSQFMGNAQSPMRNVQTPTGGTHSPMGMFQSPRGVQQSPGPNSPYSLWPSTGFNVWQSPQQKPAAPFGIFEQSLEENQPRGSAMKTAFKVLNADDLAETGSRGGMDVAAQATDSAKPMPQFSDNSSSSTEDNFDDCRGQIEDDYVNTDVFNFNLTAMKVSTPQKGNRENNALSTILEESKVSYGSSSSSGSNAKSVHLNKTNKMSTISEEHNSYLAQNLMANAALRSSLLADYMDVAPAHQSVIIDDEEEEKEAIEPNDIDAHAHNRTLPAPASVHPLDYVPSDPFKSGLINKLLERVAFPGPHVYGYRQIQCIPRLGVKKEPVVIGHEKYIVEKQLGKGTFGTVYKALDLGNCKTVAMKYQKPANKWEFYICRELQSRLAQHPLRDRFMDIPLAYFGDQASLIISEYIPGGSLLDLANSYKQKLGKSMKECLVIYFCKEMLQIIQAMHHVRIIHADIKPDNFLVFVGPDNTVGLQLIDFGCSIDMTLFPSNATFNRRVTTEDFVCCEMLDGRPWNYHTDLFCIAASAHVLLFDSYIKLQKRDNLWSIQQRFPRYLKVDLWNMFFSSLLNQQVSRFFTIFEIMEHFFTALKFFLGVTFSDTFFQCRCILMFFLFDCGMIF